MSIILKYSQTNVKYGIVKHYFCLQTRSLTSITTFKLDFMRTIFQQKSDKFTFIRFLHDESRNSVDQIEFPSDKKGKPKSTKRLMYLKHAVPGSKTIILFPGQGSQFVGMGKKIIQYPGVKHLYQEASDFFKMDLLKLCLTGPKSDLDKTINCQPAVFVTSLAAVEAMKETNPLALEACGCTAGYSLGEITACAFAGVLSFSEGLKLIQTRAYSMQEDSEAVPSGMMTVTISHMSKLGLAMEAARQACIEIFEIQDPVIRIASHLTMDHKVLAGHNEALKFIEDNAKDFGLRNCKHLAVSGAFHTPLMKNAFKEVTEVLKTIRLKSPQYQVRFNIDGKATSDPVEIKRKLTRNLYKSVQWQQMLQFMYDRKAGEEFPETYEVGPGKQLGYLLGLTNKKALRNYHKIEV